MSGIPFKSPGCRLLLSDSCGKVLLKEMFAVKESPKIQSSADKKGLQISMERVSSEEKKNNKFVFSPL
jgi:hypothetical protein